MKKAQIQPGDRFVRVGKVKTVWVVKRLLSLQDMPRHVHICADKKADHRILTFSESALLDKNFFEPLREDKVIH